MNSHLSLFAAVLLLYILSPLHIVAQKGQSPSSQLTLSHATGFYPSHFDLSVDCSSCDDIRYTTDGSEPDQQSEVLRSTINTLALRNTDTISLIPTTAVPNLSASEGNEFFAWKAPGEVRKGVVLSVRGYRNGEPCTPVHRATYVFDPKEGQLPVLFMYMAPEDLFDEKKGIYVPGETCVPENSVWTGNYHQKGKDWERPVHVSLLENGKLTWQQDMGVRVHGLKIPAAPQKSLRLYAKGKYGEKYITYPWFGHHTENRRRIILRSPYSAWRSRLISDMVAHELCKPLHLDVMDMQPVSVYLNGEYWGMHFVRERVDEHYLANHHSIDKDDVVVRSHKAPKQFAEFLNNLESKDMSSASSMEWVESYLDVENFMDYMIVETHLANHDWDDNNNNVYPWSTQQGRAFQFIPVDLDATLLSKDADMFNKLRRDSSTWISRIFFKLSENPEFRKEFILRYHHLLETALSPERVAQVVDSISALISPEMKMHLARWGHPESMAQWQKELESIKECASYRKSKSHKLLNKHFPAAMHQMDAPDQEPQQESSASNYIWLIVLGCAILTGLVLFIYRRRRY